MADVREHARRWKFEEGEPRSQQAEEFGNFFSQIFSHGFVVVTSLSCRACPSVRIYNDNNDIRSIMIAEISDSVGNLSSESTNYTTFTSNKFFSLLFIGANSIFSCFHFIVKSSKYIN